MAIAGGATVAYRCRLVNGTLQRDKDTAMQTPPPLPAAAAIMRGESVMVAGSDVVVVARLIELEQMVAQKYGIVAGIVVAIIIIVAVYFLYSTGWS